MTFGELKAIEKSVAQMTPEQWATVQKSIDATYTQHIAELDKAGISSSGDTDG